MESRNEGSEPHPNGNSRKPLGLQSTAKNKAKGKRASSITLDQWIKFVPLTLN